jgi:hypothetical protein
MPAGERIPREVLLHEISRALREQMPDRCEPMIRELEKRLLRDPPSIPRSLSASTALFVDAHAPSVLAEAAIALVNGIEKRLPEGARYRWAASVQGSPNNAMRVEVRATPLKTKR